MGAQPELAVTHAKKPEAEADQPPRGKEGAMDEAAVVLHRQEQFARDHVALRPAPHVSSHRLAGGELVMRPDEPDLDSRGRRRWGSGRHAPHASAPSRRHRYELLTRPGALTPRVIEDECAASLRIRIPDILPRKVRVPGGGHELEQPAGTARAVDGEWVVMALAVGEAECPAQAGTVSEHGVDSRQAIPA